MSMIGNLARVPEHVRIALHKDPVSIRRLLYADEEVNTEVKSGFFRRLFGKGKGAASPVAAGHVLPEADRIDIDKAWHVLHFLLTGTSWEGDLPQGFLVSAGHPVGDEDVGYGPARSLSVPEVKALSEFLSGVDAEVLRQGFVPSRLAENEIYPNGWDTDIEWDYFEEAFHDTARFVRDTAEKKMALLVYLN
jgi:hypothetical protein